MQKVRKLQLVCQMGLYRLLHNVHNRLAWQRFFKYSYILIVVTYLLSSAHATLAAGTWTQTTWSSGSGSSTTTQYAGNSNVDATTTAGQLTLNKSEALSNTGFESDLTGWSTADTQATPVKVQSIGTRDSFTTSHTLSFASTPTAGNTLFAVVSLNAATTMTTPSGWTLDSTVLGTTSIPTKVFRKVAGASEPTAFSFTQSSGSIVQIDLYEFSGIATTSPLDQIVTGNSTVASTSFSPGTTPTTTTNKELALAVAGFETSVSSPNWDGTYTAGPTASTYIGRTGYKTLTSTQTVTGTVSSGTSTTARGAILTYKAAEIATATRDTTTTHSSSTGSAKLMTSSAGSGTFLQSVNVGDTNVYNLEAYAYTTGAAVTSSDATLYYDGSALSTTYTSVGGGWYKLSGTLTGAASSKNFGVQVSASKTVYVDDFSVNKYAATGTVTSNIFDTGVSSNWGTVSYTSSGSGTVQVKVRSSNSATMSGATVFSSCTAITNGSDVSTGTGGCVSDVQRYIQYEVTLGGTNTSNTPTFDDISVSYTDSDIVAPTTNASNLAMYNQPSGTSVSSGAWSNAATPYFSWDAGQDDSGGVGLLGYCLYLGTSSTGDPITSKGMLGTSPIDSNGACPFVVSGTSVNLATSGLIATALTTSSSSYYLNIKAIDQVGNIYTGSSASFNFKFDDTQPNNPAYISAPSNFISTKSATLSWTTSGGDSPSDADSGLAGLQYRIGSSGTWYGDNHSGSQDSSDLLSNDGSYTTQSSPDFANLVDGNNVIYFRTWDNAGNVSQATVTTVLKINTAGAPSSPRNITATPSTNTQNSFAFSWLAPASYVGQSSNITYCYTINTQPTEQTCTFTNGGVLSVSAGAYATQPGTNTFYVVAKDESGGINYATASSVDFTANTSAPGMPLSVDIADTSVKATSNWRLVVSWELPTDVGAGVSKYQVYRSTDNSSFTLAGSTGGTSYVDSGLQSRLYYYKIRACDSANNCGAYSSTETKTPTGRFTSPPTIDEAPRAENIGTRKAKIIWTTDRKADSKVAFGTSTGVYQPAESYNSADVTTHTIELNNLSPGTTYYYQTRWTDSDGNTGQSDEFTFATLSPPTVEDAAPTAIGLHSATIQYTTTGASATKLYYGKTSGFGGVVELNTSINKSTYNAPLSDLDDGVKYFYKVNTVDADGNEYEGTTLSFTTPQAPHIENLRFQPIENEPSSSQKVTWQTNVPASTEVSYGVNGFLETSADGTLKTDHEVIIRGLKDDSLYKLVARSRDGGGNLATSDQQVFKTALDTRPPQISDVVIDTSIRGTGAEARGQVVLSWRTDEPATSQVAYGENGGSLGNTTNEDTRLSYEHIVVVSDLATSRVYHLEPRSFDRARNKGSGEEQVAIIGRASDSVLSIIFNALQQLFGVQ